MSATMTKPDWADEAAEDIQVWDGDTLSRKGVAEALRGERRKAKAEEGEEHSPLHHHAYQRQRNNMRYGFLLLRSSIS